MLDKEKYAVKVVQVQEVLLHTKITPVLSASSEVLGFVNLRGNVVAVCRHENSF